MRKGLFARRALAARPRISGDDRSRGSHSDSGRDGISFAARHECEQRNGWRQALAINAILLLIYAARAVFRGTAGADCDIRIAASEDLTTPDCTKGFRL